MSCVPYSKRSALPDISVLPKTNRYLLSPIFDDQEIIQENVDYCVELVKRTRAGHLACKCIN